MISENTKRQATEAQRLNNVQMEIEEAVQSGKFTYTRALMLEEPWKTMALMAIDGHVLDNGRPVHTGATLDLPDVRLVTINEHDHIYYKVWSRERVPGTDKIKQGWKRVKGTNDMTLPHIVARQILFKNGFPVIDDRTRGSKTGGVVEMSWLEQEAQLPDAKKEIVELWQKIKERTQKKQPKNMQ